MVLTYDLLEDIRIGDVNTKTLLILYYVKQIDSKLPCVCSVIDYRSRTATWNLFVKYIYIYYFPFAGQEVPITPNTMMEKRSVDDLFRKLMDFGIIKVMPEPVSEPPQHVALAAPPQAEIQKPRTLPGPPVSLPGLSLPAITAEQTQPPKVEKPGIPPIKLVPEDLKK